jgi:hypothetical protein
MQPAQGPHMAWHSWWMRHTLELHQNKWLTCLLPMGLHKRCWWLVILAKQALSLEVC